MVKHHMITKDREETFEKAFSQWKTFNKVGVEGMFLYKSKAMCDKP